jgi:tRNA(fMet)-specific endonuclease VapC
MKDRVLVDTSVWIEFFRKKDSTVSESLKKLLRDDRAAYTGIISLELYHGAIDRQSKEFLDKFLPSITYIPIMEHYFKEAGELGLSIKKEGIIINTVDLLIALIAIKNGMPIFSLDQHFILISRETDLKLYSMK